MLSLSKHIRIYGFNIPVKHFASLILSQALGFCVLLELGKAESGVAVLSFEPVFEGARVVPAVDPPATDKVQIVLKI